MLFVGACGGNKCEGVGLSRILPRDTTLIVGRSTTATFQDGGYCVGRAITDANYVSRTRTGRYSTNPVVAKVDAATGVITALAVGEATIGADGAQAAISGATVHVRN